MKEQLLKIKIKQDLLEAFPYEERIETFAFLFRSTDKREYQHFLDAYDITEEFFKDIIYELRNPGKIKRKEQ